MGSSWFLFLFMGILSFGNSGKISLDVSGIVDLPNQLKIYTYHVLSYLDHLATDNMKLKLSPKAFQKFPIFQNVTRAGISFHGLTDIPNYETIAKNALKKLEANLSDESIFLIKALSSKTFKIPLAFKPTDETLQETINFMDALKQYWRYIDEVTALEVEELDPFNVASNLKEIFINRTKDYKMETEREGRNFLIPDVPLQVSEKNIEYLLTHIFTSPRSFDSEEGILEKSFIRNFITKAFEELNLIVLNHEFSVHENDYEYGKEILGSNIVGVLPGERWGTSEDSPLLVGAHYDTMPNTTGTIDNASGTTAVIEVARILSSSKCKFKNSVFFVAFDLEEIGIQGSFMFVKDFLLKILFPTFGIKTFGGALILDCVANWDPNIETQEVPDAWEEKVHGFKQRMDERQNTGDFVAVIYRKIPDNKLAEKFHYYYCHLKDTKFRLELMPLNELKESRPNTTVNMENFDFFRSDHYRFWYPSEVAPSISLPALLITDTAPYRGKMKKCYHQYCDTVESIQPNFKFLAKISTASAWMIADLAIGSCNFLNIPEMFQMIKERTHEDKGSHELKKRPSVSPEGVLEFLKFLGKVKTTNFDRPVNEIVLKVPDSSEFLTAPIHRFSFPTKPTLSEPSLPDGSSQFNQITITIHGENSTFLIPLKIDYSEQANKYQKFDPLSSSATDNKRTFPSFLINDLAYSIIDSNTASNMKQDDSKNSSRPTTKNINRTSTSDEEAKELKSDNNINEKDNNATLFISYDKNEKSNIDLNFADNVNQKSDNVTFKVTDNKKKISGNVNSDFSDTVHDKSNNDTSDSVSNIYLEGDNINDTNVTVNNSASSPTKKNNENNHFKKFTIYRSDSRSQSNDSNATTTESSMNTSSKESINLNTSITTESSLVTTANEKISLNFKITSTESNLVASSNQDLKNGSILELLETNTSRPILKPILVR